VTDCGCHVEQAQTARERRTLLIALTLNAAMFVVGLTAGIVGHSSGLLADALDMLADACAYAIALLAIGRTFDFKRRAAFTSGVILPVLGVTVIIDAMRRALLGSEPQGWIMVAAATLSLAVNMSVLRMLSRFRRGEVHLRVSWLFTRADVIANGGVIVAALLVIAAESRIPDLVIGLAIGVFVVKEAFELLREAQVRDPTGKA
jgi:cation diffusion facilitator family transporter